MALALAAALRAALAGGGGRVLATCRAPDRAEELLRVAEASGGRATPPPRGQGKK